MSEKKFMRNGKFSAKFSISDGKKKKSKNQFCVSLYLRCLTNKQKLERKPNLLYTLLKGLTKYTIIKISN